MCGTPTTLPLAETSSSGCACCAPQEESVPAAAPAGLTTSDFSVTGLTCGSCASRVSTAVGGLEGVDNVRVSLVAGGSSTLSVSSSAPLQEDDIIAAVEQAGYRVTTQ